MSSDPLKSLLEDLRHLDVSSRIQTGELKAIGGYSDIYDGFLTLQNRGDKRKVAIKRSRTYADPEKDFSKVRISFNMYVRSLTE